jgi:hypothetical protein
MLGRLEEIEKYTVQPALDRREQLVVGRFLGSRLLGLWRNVSRFRNGCVVVGRSIWFIKSLADSSAGRVLGCVV